MGHPQPDTPGSASSSSSDILAKPALKGGPRQLEQSDLPLKRNALGEVDETVVLAEGEDRTTLFVWFLVAAAATGGILFGYDVSAIGFDVQAFGTDSAFCTRRLVSSEALSFIATSPSTSDALRSRTRRRRCADLSTSGVFSR